MNRRQQIQQSIMQDPSYRIAFEDLEFLMEDDLRPVRLQLELLKPELYLRNQNIASTVVVFGSVRSVPAEVARKQLHNLLKQRVDGQENDALEKSIHTAAKRLHYSQYYEEARRFARLISERFQQENRKDLVVVTGGGSGIMEAASLGAKESGGVTVAFNIALPQEQQPNPFVTPGLCFQFHYFGIRKMHLLMRAKALVAFPGGFGTLDELFESLTLLQTHKIPFMPVVLIGKSFWEEAIRFDFLLQEGMIDEGDLKLFHIVENAEEAIDILSESLRTHSSSQFPERLLPSCPE